jgi:hypothetical protein
VFSSTLERAEWHNSTIIRGDVVAEVTRLKQQAGQDLITYGHGLLAETLLKHRLLDVLDLAIHPVVVEEGSRSSGRASTRPCGSSRPRPTRTGSCCSPTSLASTGNASRSALPSRTAPDAEPIAGSARTHPSHRR